MDRYAEHAALEIPESDIDDSEEPDRELVGAVELPEAVPEPFAPVGALADELIPQHAVDDVGQHRPAPLMVGLADRPLVRCDPQHGGRAGLPPSRGARRQANGG